MERQWIDLRSDTVTRPSEGMRKAMASAEVGDDVFIEDPSINKLQERCAELTGHEAALFMPTGTMANEVAINIHTQPGDEVYVEEDAHINNYELSAMAAYSGVLARPICSEHGWITSNQLEAAMRGQTYFLAQPGLVVLENTHNMKGGKIYPQDAAESVIKFSRDREIPIHLDGARITNAAAATGISMNKLMGPFDSAMFTFSKGLGCPAGSVLVGSKEFISEARIVRKRMGGGMRQVGILAAACLYALDQNLSRLREDHERASHIAKLLSQYEQVKVTPPETNILVIELSGMTASEFGIALEAEGIKSIPIGLNKMRLVTHLDIRDEDLKRIESAIQKTLD